MACLGSVGMLPLCGGRLGEVVNRLIYVIAGLRSKQPVGDAT